MTPLSKAAAAPGKPFPSHQACTVSLESLHCVLCKKTGHFCSKICWEKSFSAFMICGALCRLVVCPSNEHNNGHLRPQHGLFVCLMPMSLLHKQITHFCGDGLREKPLWSFVFDFCILLLLEHCFCLVLTSIMCDFTLVAYKFPLLLSFSLDRYCCCSWQKASSIQTWLVLWLQRFLFLAGSTQFVGCWLSRYHEQEESSSGQLPCTHVCTCQSATGNRTASFSFWEQDSSAWLSSSSFCVQDW